MDRALIERMVGATVLVLLLVIVAPALLDGSRTEPDGSNNAEAGQQLRTEVILLNESEARRAAQSASSASDNRDSPAPSMATQEATVAVSAAESERPAAQEPERSAAKAVAEARARGNFAVQLGSFREQANAAQFAGRIRRKGFSVFVQPADSSSGQVYRVYAGPRPSRDAAESLTATLAQSGYDGIVVEMASN